MLPDDLLPHVVDLAVNSSDRQTKVAASELLHSIIILMIGTGKQYVCEYDILCQWKNCCS